VRDKTDDHDSSSAEDKFAPDSLHELELFLFLVSIIFLFSCRSVKPRLTKGTLRDGDILLFVCSCLFFVCSFVCRQKPSNLDLWYDQREEIPT